MQKDDAQEIEVEVVEIDGAAPVVARDHPADAPESQASPPWQQWQGRVKHLDARWWPLWVFLGIIALALALTVGLVIAVIYLVIRFLVKLVRAIFG